MTKDYYKSLGIARNATKDEIKKAYRELALKYHPDKNPDKPGMEKEFYELTSAYKFLAECSRSGVRFSTERDLKNNPVLVKLRD